MKNPEFENYLGKIYPVDLDIKGTTENNPSASITHSLTSVDSTLPFMTNVAISISISHIFRSCLAIFHLLPLMASSSRSLYDMPGPAPGMDVLLWWRRDFPISFLTMGYFKERLKSSLRKFYGRYGDLSNNMKFPSHECWILFRSLAIYNDNPHQSDFILICNLITELDHLPNYERFP